MAPHPNPSDERRIVWAISPGKPPTLVLGLTNACIADLQAGAITDIEFDKRRHTQVPFDLRVMTFSAPTRADVLAALGQGNSMQGKPPPEDATGQDFGWQENPVAVERVMKAAARYLRARTLPTEPAEDAEWLRGLVMAMARGEP